MQGEQVIDDAVAALYAQEQRGGPGEGAAFDVEGREGDLDSVALSIAGVSGMISLVRKTFSPDSCVRRWEKGIFDQLIRFF